ncbi:branched-chain amino acid aminotransferase [Desulfovibrio litoralis]|uniref:branched-chain-amino-acid transaminase n=1 Tax=Desulfovibrio litoralis DSM 11393 TaxID=1121455 RepID=A0A1M7TK10_9BACT|nr:branched-chain amino acid aminotransferase [Desulfovibrio litoralis]SHN71055.1 branched-chain amino acid aminotransferase [Desulfovibrio litoralis DSM 11393]
MKFDYQLLEKSKQKEAIKTIKGVPFGSVRTNHMFLMDYAKGEWKNARIVPYGEINLPAGALCLHYGQAIFEGIKAFRQADGSIKLWRADKNAMRINHSATIMCMPHIPVELQLECIQRLIDVERDWCPNEPDAAMYIRPFMFATYDSLGVKVSCTYTYCIMLSPCGPYYSGGFDKAIRLVITDKFHRAVAGGTGTAKCVGNYGASLRPGEYAKSRGADQVLYLDASNTYLEEAGTMNHYNVLKDGTFIIPAFNDSILRSITSETILELAEMGTELSTGKLKARLEQIPLNDFINGLKSGEIIEAGGFGTAAVVSPVGSYLMDDDTVHTVADGKVGKYSRALYEYYTAMQNGTKESPKGWLLDVPKFDF